MTLLDFAFANIYLPAAFFVAGFFVMFKFQWQALLYMMVVTHAVTSWAQFMFVSVIAVVHVAVSAFKSAANKSD